LFERDKVLNKSSVKTYKFNTKEKERGNFVMMKKPEESVEEWILLSNFKKITFLVIIDQLCCELIKRRSAYEQLNPQSVAISKNKPDHCHPIGRNGKDSI